MNIIPAKLQKGDEIRVIAPATGFKKTLTLEIQTLATKRLNELGLKVSYGKYVNEVDEFESTTIEHRLEDLHDAFSDKNVKAILTVLGGSASNQLLAHIDYEFIKNNPKILCGLSDITSLANAITTKTGLVTYSGPHFTLFGAEKQVNYTIDYFKKCFFTDDVIKLESSALYCNARWDEEEMVSDGFWVINNGQAEGKIIGGNLITLNMLQGSEYMPDLAGTIIFIEDNKKENIRAVQNHLQALINQPNFDKVRGIVIGRFQLETKMTKELLIKIIKTKKELDNIPIVANVDFGHTTPMITFPIGGTMNILAEGNMATLEILRH